MSTHHPRRRFSGKLTVFAVGTALALSPILATAAPNAAPTSPQRSTNAAEPLHKPLSSQTPYGATQNTDALLAAHWLENSIIESDGLMPNFGEPDWGITLDSLISLAALGTGTAAAEIALERFATEGETFVDYGSDQTAKAAYTLLVYGKDPQNFFEGRDLISELRAATKPNGAIGEIPNPFGQAFAILAFARTESGVPDETAAWLAGQQCADTEHENYGAYGVPWDDMEVCDVADADTTGVVVQALAAAELDPNAPEIAAGLNWLTSNLNDDGAIETWGDTNANSTALAAQALDHFDLTEGAQAREFLASQVLKPSEVEPSDVLGRADAGLLPASSENRTLALASGTGEILDLARLATSQAGWGMGGRGLIEITAAGASAAAPAPQFTQPASPQPVEPAVTG